MVSPRHQAKILNVILLVVGPVSKVTLGHEDLLLATGLVIFVKEAYDA